MATSKYLVVYKGLNSVVPQSLRAFVKNTISSEFSAFDMELDFTGSKPVQDLVVTFSREIPAASLNGESKRMNKNDKLESGSTVIFVEAMKAVRIQAGPGVCGPAFQETVSSLGSLIANTTIHEMGHMLGISDGGFDDGGHTADVDNYMWSSLSLSGPSDFASSPFIYTVKSGDTLSGIWHRYVNGTLDKCRIGPWGWTYMDVWDDQDNKAEGFIAHPTKSGVPGRRANDPNWIYPGEKVALPNFNLRTQDFRRKMRGFLGKKSFTDEQKDRMRRFIASRLVAGK